MTLVMRATKLNPTTTEWRTRSRLSREAHAPVLRAFGEAL
jgi:hypothetical protein